MNELSPHNDNGVFLGSDYQKVVIPFFERVSKTTNRYLIPSL